MNSSKGTVKYNTGTQIIATYHHSDSGGNRQKKIEIEEKNNKNKKIIEILSESLKSNHNAFS